MKPLAIDLYCGLVLKAEFLWRTNAFVQKLVARRAQNPDHVSLAIRHQAPTAFALEARAMRNLDNAGLAASLATFWKVWILSSKACRYRVFVWPTRVIDLLDPWILAMESTALNFCRLCRASVRAIALIAVRRRDVEMLSAYAAITPKFSDIRLFASTQTALARLATVRAVTLVRALCPKCSAAHCAE